MILDPFETRLDGTVSGVDWLQQLCSTSTRAVGTTALTNAERNMESRAGVLVGLDASVGGKTLRYSLTDSWTSTDQAYVGDFQRATTANAMSLSKVGKLSQISKNFSFRNAVEVWKFLLADNHLIDLLIEGIEKIKLFFGDDIDVILEYIAGEHGERDKVFAYVQIQDMDVETAFKRLKTLDERWFLSKLNRVNVPFNISLEFA